MTLTPPLAPSAPAATPPAPQFVAVAPARGLTYPAFEIPGRGHSVEIAPGVRWIRMPLPISLAIINLWAIDDGDAGWAVVDTGMAVEDAARVWQNLFDNAPDARSLSRVLVTHMHPDHVGMAGWLTRKFRVRLWMTRGEYLACRVTVADTGREAPPDATAFYHRAGWNRQAVESYWVRFGNFGKFIHALPDSYHRLVDGEELRIGRHMWRVVVGLGHSPEHACLYCPDLKLLISGDQVLPRISSNVSVYPLEPNADPMSDWLASIDKLRRAVPDDVLVLPSHNEPFRGLHERLDALAQGQAEALARLREWLVTPRRVVDTFPALFAREITEAKSALLGMATGEAQACLNHLLRRGEALADTDDAGVAWYRRA